MNTTTSPFEKNMKNFKLKTTLVNIIAFWFLVIACNNKKDTYLVVNQNELDSLFTVNLEKGYFEGQKDLLQGRQVIELNEEDSVYHWVKSPWSDNKPPVFQPTKEDSKPNFKEE